MSTLRSSRSARVIAGSLTAALATSAAALSHGSAAAAPSLFAVVVATVLTTPLAIFALGRRHTRLALSTAVLLIQALFHWVFIWFTPPQIAALGAHHGGHPTAGGATAPAFAVHAAPDAIFSTPAMLGAHLLAAVIAAVLLLSAEHAYRLLWRLSAVALHAVATLQVLNQHRSPQRAPRCAAVTICLTTQLLLHSRSLRAPPHLPVSQ